MPSLAFQTIRAVIPRTSKRKSLELNSPEFRTWMLLVCRIESRRIRQAKNCTLMWTVGQGAGSPYTVLLNTLVPNWVIKIPGSAIRQSHKTTGMLAISPSIKCIGTEAQKSAIDSNRSTL